MDLTEDEAREAAISIMEGKASEAEMASFLTGMRMKGETAEELAAIAGVMRERCKRVRAPDGTMDLCGTGGARVKTYNVSTVSSFVVASSGVPVAKHGNRSVTSRSGSADLLEALGINISIEPDRASAMLREAGITFLFAPLYHPAMKNVSPVRKALPFRTVFNILGPLTNPALVSSQLIGVFSESYVGTIAGALSMLGIRRAMVAHGMIGLDEISPEGKTDIAEVKNGSIERYTLDASEFSGFGTGKWSAPHAHGPEESALYSRRVLGNGSDEGERSIVLLNAGAALYVAGKASTLEKGMEEAADAIQSGRAMEKLDEFRRLSTPGGHGNG